MGAGGRCLVVIGASAGGVQALTRLAAGLPADLAAAVVVVLHVAPAWPSALPAILDRSGELPAAAATHGAALVPGRISVAPPDHHVLVSDDRLVLDRGPKRHGARPAIDPLFETAARAAGAGVVGVILSGTLDDGAAGLEAVKRRGGVAVVQDPTDALHPGMPLHALERVAVDHVVPVDRMAALIAQLVGGGRDATLEVTGGMTKEAEALDELLEFLRRQRGFDFTGYKRPSLERRVRARMEQVGCKSYGAYLDHLQVHPDEFSQLFDAILINVTAFFRDPSAWTHLRERALPEVVSARRDGELRVWSAGCATGEEAYSIAMCLVEQLGAEQFLNRVKIYATDVDEQDLVQARLGTYPAQALKDAPQDLVERCFERVDGRLAFRRDLRRNVIFGRNDLLQDAPISRIDVLICRNTLMYFTAEAQARILARFNFALQRSGILFLGKSEMLLTHSELFMPLDLKSRIFAKVPRESLRERLAFVAGNGEAEPLEPVPEPLREGAFDSGQNAQIVIGEDGALAQVNQQARSLFGLAAEDVGRPLQDLEISYRPLELRSPMQQALADRRSVNVPAVLFRPAKGSERRLDVQISPLIAAGGTHLGTSVTFADVTTQTALSDELDRSKRELEVAHEELQSTVEELETTNEELQSTNEELETTNEELQSTNEELETMNEELQSTNEELHAINDELRGRTVELNNVNASFEAILKSLQVGVAVVDHSAVVRIWNAQADDIWGVRTEEAVGHHVYGLDIGLPLEQLRAPLRAALAGESPEPLELDATNRRGRAFRCKVVSLPLHGTDAGDGDADGEVRGAIILMEPLEL